MFGACHQSFLIGSGNMKAPFHRPESDEDLISLQILCAAAVAADTHTLLSEVEAHRECLLPAIPRGERQLAATICSCFFGSLICPSIAPGPGLDGVY